MLILITALAVMTVIFLVTFICYQYGDWKVFNTSNLKSASHKGGTAYLKWNVFKPFYTLSPQRFRYEPIIRESFNYATTYSNFLIFNSGSSEWKKNSCDAYIEADKIIRIQLSFFCFLKFKWMMKFPKNSQGNIDIIIDAIKKDIEDKQALAQKQIQQATRDIKNIMDRLSEENKV